MINENIFQTNQRSHSKLKNRKDEDKSYSSEDKNSSKNSNFCEEMDNKAQITIEIERLFIENDENNNLNSMEPKTRKLK